MRLDPDPTATEFCTDLLGKFASFSIRLGSLSKNCQRNTDWTQNNEKKLWRSHGISEAVRKIKMESVRERFGANILSGPVVFEREFSSIERFVFSLLPAQHVQVRRVAVPSFS